LSDEKVLGNIAAMVIGGHHTTATQVAWIMYDVASHPEVQARCMDELRAAGLLSTVTSRGRTVAWDDLTSLEYLNATVKESMRLHAVAGSTSTIREADRDVEIAGVDVPKGTVVWLPVIGMHLSDETWGDALAFRPGRWLADGGISSDAAAAYMPFGRGPRDCIGQNMAITSTKVYVIEMLRRFWFDVDPRMGSKDEVHSREEMAITLGVHGGIHLLAKEHKQN